MADQVISVPSTQDSFLGSGGIGALLIGALLFGGGFGGFGNRGNMGWGGGNAGWAEAAKNDVVLNPAFQSLQTQIQSLQGQLSANDLRNEMESVENTFATISSGQTSQFTAGFRDVTSQIGQLQTAQAAGNFTTLQSINGLQAALTAQGTQALINEIQNFNSLNGNLVNSTNQIIAQGTALAAQVANCCCDLKTAILADGNATRALINQLDKENLQAQLADAKGNVSNLNQTIALQNALNAQSATIINHLKPRDIV